MLESQQREWNRNKKKVCQNCHRVGVIRNGFKTVLKSDLEMELLRWNQPHV